MGNRADYWATRIMYREKFGLSAEQMDDETAEEVVIAATIWKAQGRKSELENLRNQQSTSSNG